MKNLFNIKSNRQSNNPYTLLMEIGSDHCSYAFFDKDAQAIDQINYFVFDEVELESHLNDIVNDIRKNNFENVLVSSAFSQALLVPRNLFHDDYSMLNVVYDQPIQTHLHDVIPEWQLVVMYSVPESLHQLFQSNFSAVKFMHAYTSTIKIYNGFVAENQISIHFSHKKFRVLVKKSRQILLVQTYNYQTPLDVVYYLLKICYEFGLQQSEVQLILCGLLEKDSALFKELQSYFTNLHFTHPPVLRLPQDEHPHYFFSSLHNLAACVS